MKRHHGIRIVQVKVLRYEVRTVDDRKVRSFSTLTAAKAWAAGYAKAYDQFAAKAAAVRRDDASDPE